MRKVYHVFNGRNFCTIKQVREYLNSLTIDERLNLNNALLSSFIDGDIYVRSRVLVVYQDGNYIFVSMMKGSE